MAYQCELKEQPMQAVLSIRTRTRVENLPVVLGQAYGAIAQYLGESGQQPAGPPFAGYFNMDMQDLDIEAGFPIASNLPGRGDIKVSEIPACKAVSCLYIGPYSDIEPAYNDISRWIADNGYEASGVVYEMYLNDPDQTPPQELKTQILFLIKD